MKDALIDCQKHPVFTTPSLLDRIKEQKHDGWISRTVIGK